MLVTSVKVSMCFIMWLVLQGFSAGVEPTHRPPSLRSSTEFNFKQFLNSDVIASIVRLGYYHMT